jgi:hypothetical protein
MPAIGFIVAGKEYLYEEAFSIARSTGFFEGFPPAAVQAMQRTRTDGHWLSPSAAGGCPRQRVLAATEDFYHDFKGEWSPGVGTAVHGWLHEAVGSTPHVVTERNLRTELLVPLRDGRVVPFDLQGTLDYYDPELKRAYDYKTVTDFDYWHNGKKQWIPRDLPSESHILQANLYTYLLRRNGFEVSEYWLWYVRLNKDGQTKPFLVDLWEDEDIEQLACNLAEPLAWYRETGEIPTNRYDSKIPVCRYCPLKSRCRELTKEGV